MERILPDPVAALMGASAPAPSSPPLPLAPGPEGTSQRQGGWKPFLTRAILWVLQEDNLGQTLPEAWRLLVEQLRALLGELGTGIRAFFQRYVMARWHRVRHDWERSGEAVRKESARRRRKTR